jgi:RNA polymerase sigma-70 factor, ECF subfamily
VNFSDEKPSVHLSRPREADVVPARSKTAVRVGRPLETKERCAKQHYGTCARVTTAAAAPGRPDDIIRAAPIRRGQPRRQSALATDKELSDFLKSVEKRAFKRTVYAVRDDDAALDIVQDAMIRLAEKYADRPAAELPLVFQRILSNATMDWFRRQKVRARCCRTCRLRGRRRRRRRLRPAGSLQTPKAAGHRKCRRCRVAGTDPASDRRRVAACPRVNGKPSCCVTGKSSMSETAEVMGCSEGSVKTHCSRAVQALAKALRPRESRRS